MDSAEKDLNHYIQLLKTQKRTVILSVPGIISNWNNQKDIDVLIAALNENYWLIRTCAATALGNLQAVAAVPSLLDAYNNDEDEDVREEIVRTLGKIRDSRAFDTLINALENDPESTVRYFAAIALGELGDVRAIPHLIKVEEKDFAITRERDEVRDGAAEAIAILTKNEQKRN